MLVIPDATTAWIDVFQRRTDIEFDLHHRRSDHSPTVRSRTRAVLRRKRRLISNPPALRTLHSLDRKRNFLFSTMCDLRIVTTRRHTSSIAPKDIGNSAREEFPNLGYKIRAKEGYFPVSPMDSLQDIRNEMCLELEKAGVAIERQHHEVATAGQAEIDIRFAPLKRMGDNMQYYKYILPQRRQTTQQDRDVHAENRFLPITGRVCTHTCRFGKTKSRSLPVTATPGCRSWRCFSSAEF